RVEDARYTRLRRAGRTSNLPSHDREGFSLAQTKRRRLEAPPFVDLHCDPRREPGAADVTQWAVRVEDSSSTGGSVVTEVSVGFAFSSSHSIGSGLRTRARARTSSMRETGTISRFFLMLSLISTRSFALSSGISTVLMPPRVAASSFSLRPPIGRTR